MADAFAQIAPGLCDPPSNGFAVTPDDGLVFDQPTRMLWVGGAGNIALRLLAGSIITLAACPAGVLLPLRADKVLATNTTATNLVGLW